MSAPRPRLILARDAGTIVELDGRRPSDVPTLHRVRRGAYVDEAAWRDAGERQRYELLVRGTIPALRRPPVLAHESAAVLLRIPVIGPWPDVVHVIGKPSAGGRSSAKVVHHGVREQPGLAMVGDVVVTSPARTAVDLARTRSFASGLAAADHVLRTGLATREDLEAELAKTRGRRGHQRARLVVRHADGRAESVGESLSRAQMIELGLPTPVLQQEFYDDEGLIGRTDFWWPELRTIGEFDGFVKFGRALVGDDADARLALWEEKRREDRLRRQGNGVVRWTWDEAFRRDGFARLLAAAGIR
ncbi:MAG TPA: hypothetical protein VKZ83_10980 [Phototrophicaceae bacterium]|nr:hypothetical protein [Phototrophicaceae bacterium]